MPQLKQNLTGTITSELTSAGFRDARSLEKIIAAPKPPEIVNYLSKLGNRVIDGDSLVDAVTDLVETLVEKKLTQIENVFTQNAKDIPNLALGKVDGLIKSKLDNTFPKLLADVSKVEAARKVTFPAALKSISEPPTPFAAQYPYNSASISESGHAVEIDDTPGSERIHTYHRSGAFVEFHPDGKIVLKSVGGGYIISVKDQTIMAEGNLNIITNSAANVSVVGNAAITVGGQTDLQVGGDANVTVNKNATVNVTGNMTHTVQGNYNITVAGNYKVTAARIDLN